MYRGRKQSYRSYSKHICEICNKICNSKAGLVSHCRNISDVDHIKYLEKIKSKKNNTGHFECKICKKHTNQIKQHVIDKHKITWEYYCNCYNHDINNTIFFTDIHRTKLSASAIKVYKRLFGNKKLTYKLTYFIYKVIIIMVCGKHKISKRGQKNGCHF